MFGNWSKTRILIWLNIFTERIRSESAIYPFHKLIFNWVILQNNRLIQVAMFAMSRRRGKINTGLLFFYASLSCSNDFDTFHFLCPRKSIIFFYIFLGHKSTILCYSHWNTSISLFGPKVYPVPSALGVPLPRLFHPFIRTCHEDKYENGDGRRMINVGK